jgi:hypothetical protein
MEYSPEIELILKGLNRDRAEVSAKLAEIDKVIKKVKSGIFDFINPAKINDNVEANDIEHIKQKSIVFPIKGNMKVQALSIMDIIGKACKLKEIQTEFNTLTSSNINLRETIRTLNKNELIKLMREKNSNRGIYWVKTDWLEDNGTRLKDEHKFEGFDMLYKADNLEYV